MADEDPGRDTAEDTADDASGERDWIPLDQNPHADDKRDVLDPAGEETPFKRLIYLGLGIGVLVVALVVWLL